MKNQIDTRRENRPRSFLDLLTSFDDSFDRSLMEPSISRLMTNISETDQGYILSLDMPGVTQEDIQIQVDGNILNLTAEHQDEKNAKDSKEGYSRQYRRYQQSFTLPVTVNAEVGEIEASYENGVLEIFLPKSPQSQPKKVEVKAGKGSFLNRLTGKNSTANDQQKSPGKH